MLPPRADTASTSVRLLGFDEVNDEVLSRLSRLAAPGTWRVLAIAFAPFAHPRTAWQLLEHGAADVVVWRNDSDGAREVAARLARWTDVDAIVTSDVVKRNLVGRSPAWLRTIREVAEIAAYTDVPLLLGGETGTGKELIARLVHTLDRRPTKRDLVLVDCTTLMPELSGSELFGHERGAFTGAVASRDGACALANGGTLFLDEIGELPLALQAELLRVVQEGTYKRVGSNSWQQVKFRLVCATHRDLTAEVQRGTFRRDLFYRIAGITCTLPTLAERTDDIIPLAEHFIRQVRPDLDTDRVEMDDAVRDYLVGRAYPGNVRDLRQLVTRMIARHPGAGHLSVGDIPIDERPVASDTVGDWRGDAFARGIRLALAAGASLREISSEASSMAIRIAMDESASLRSAARRLGVSARALQLRRASEQTSTPPSMRPRR
ncbi:sigma 54-interacting transcriptional regulator [Gemmatimonas groenlandica]|nr:sigma 54-interacting transcriptional regulator [Gemmatimonas groenlandica]